MTRLISIRASLVRDLSLLLVILGLGILLATIIGGRRSVRLLSESLVRQALNSVESRLDAFFGEAEQQLLTARAQAIAGGFDLPYGTSERLGPEASFQADRDHRNRLLGPIIAASPQVSSLMMGDGEGREHMLLSAQGRWRNRITDTQRARWLEWSNGETPVETDEASDYDCRDRPWYVGAVAAGPDAVHWTEPYTFFTTKEPGITVSGVLKHWDGVERVIGFDMLLNDLTDFTRDLRVGERGIVAVLTEDRRFIGLPGLPAFEDAAVRNAALLQRPEDVDVTLVSDAIAAVPNRNTEAAAMYRFMSGGEAWWGRSEPYALSPTMNLRLAVLVPEAELLGNLRQLQLIISGIVVVVLAVGVWRAFAISRRFSAPIEALVAGSERITHGDLEPGSPIVAPVREIQRLVEAQEHMREGILAREKLEKIERDLDIARDIQHGLLPHTSPTASGFEIAGWNQPADKTGGDFYDWIALPNGRILVTLADVTGHGIGPALIVAVYRAYMRASTRLGRSPLAEAFGHINDLLHADMPAGRFITAVIGELDPAAASMTLLSAGHGPLLYCEGASGTVHSWDADDVPLGIMPGLEFGEPRALSFAAGDALVLVTDGFFEWANEAGEQYGLRRLEAFVSEHRHLPAQEFIEALYRSVLDHVGDVEQNDDLTAVIVRRRVEQGDSAG